MAKAAATAKSSDKKAKPATSPRAKKEAALSSRKLKTSSYRSFRLHKRIKTSGPKVPGSFRLFGRATAMLVRNWKLFGGIVLIYGVLNVLFVKGLNGGSDLGSVKSSLDQIFTGSAGHIGTGLTLFVYLLGTSGNSQSAAAGAYQVILMLLISLVIIWVLRQLYAKQKVRIRDGYYKGVYPLIPFVLVLLVMGLQAAPGGLGITLYTTVVNGGIAASAPEKFLWGVIMFLLIILSLYMLCSSLFALYIVTLPDMTPIKALRSARQLVLHRRFEVVRKILFLPIALIVLAAIVMVPLILFVTPAAPWIFFVLTMIGIAIIHSYMYALYRSLI